MVSWHCVLIVPFWMGCVKPPHRHLILPLIPTTNPPSPAKILISQYLTPPLPSLLPYPPIPSHTSQPSPVPRNQLPNRTRTKKRRMTKSRSLGRKCWNAPRCFDLIWVGLVEMSFYPNSEQEERREEKEEEGRRKKERRKEKKEKRKKGSWNLIYNKN